LPALRPFIDALQSLALTPRSQSLAFVRTQLPVVRRLLATICDSVPFIGDAISLISDSLAPQDLTLAPAARRPNSPSTSARSSLTATPP
jgi:hypothetical protein